MCKIDLFLVLLIRMERAGASPNDPPMQSICDWDWLHVTPGPLDGVSSLLAVIADSVMLAGCYSRLGDACWML